MRHVIEGRRVRPGCPLACARAETLASCVEWGGESALTKWSRLIGVIVIGLLLCDGDAAGQPRDWPAQEQEPPEEPAPPDGGTKICSVTVVNNWRDTILVPDSWEFEDCIDFARSVGAISAQVGCIFQTGYPKFSFGSPDGRPPNRNCRWYDGGPRRRMRR
jgi:hypothetical protein